MDLEIAARRLVERDWQSDVLWYRAFGVGYMARPIARAVLECPCEAYQWHRCDPAYGADHVCVSMVVIYAAELVAICDPDQVVVVATMDESELCDVTTCTRPAIRGLCTPHLLAARGPCTVEDCGRPAYDGGVCSVHHGAPL